MRYQAPLTLEHKLQTLRSDYQKKAKVDFSNMPTKLGTFFGSKDVKARLKQIQLLEVIAELDNPLNASNDREAYFDKYHLMVGLSYLVQQQIYSQNKVCPIGSELYGLLQDALNLKDNTIDQHTLNECMYTLRRFDKSKVNQALRAKGVKELTETEWQDYKLMASKHIDDIEENQDSMVADSLSYFGGLVLKPVGWGVGFAIGETIGKAGTSAPVKAALTTAISSAFIVLGPITGGGMAAATLLARPHAEKAIECAAGYGAAQVCGSGFKKVGQGLGWVVGKGIDLTLDATTNITGQAVSLVSRGEIIEENIEVGLNLVEKELTAKSTTLSQEEFIEKLKVIISEQSAAIEKDDINQNNPRVLTFALSEQEQQLLPNVLRILGYTQQQQNVGLLETAAKATEDESVLESTTANGL